MNRTVFNFHDYMLDCATRLKDIGHTDNEKHFFKANTILGVEELINNIGEANYPALVVEITTEGSIGDESRSNNFIDLPNYTFYVLGAPLQQNFGMDEIHISKQQAKSIGLKILGKMRHDRRRQLYGLHFMNFLSVNYQEVGPLGAGSYGVMFSFQVPDSNLLEYNTNDWLAE